MANIIVTAAHWLGRELSVKTKGPLYRLLYDPVLDGPPAPLVVPKGSPDSCGNPECDRPVKSKGYCARCYQRWRAHGDPTILLQASGRKPRARLRVTGTNDRTFYWPVEFEKEDKILTISQEHPNADNDIPERILLDSRQIEALRDFLEVRAPHL